MSRPAIRKWARKWAVSIVCCLVIIVTALVSAWQWTRSTSDGTVRVGKPTITAVAPVSNEPLALTTAYFATSLPHGFAVMRQAEAPDRPILLELVANGKHQQFAATVMALPTGGLVSVSDYKLRTTQTNMYAPYRPAGLPVESTAFHTLTGTPELTVFWPHGGLLTEVSVTGDGTTKLTDLFNSFVQAAHDWQWQ